MNLGIQKLFTSYFGSARTKDIPTEQQVPAIPLDSNFHSSQSHAAVHGQGAASCQPSQQPPEQLAAAAPMDAETGKAANGSPMQQQQQQQLMLTSSYSSGSLQDEDIRSATNSMSSLASQSRRTSLLGESGRASRRSSSFRDSLTDSPVPPIVQQQAALASPPCLPPYVPDSDGPFWVNSKWSFGHHSDQNQRSHMEDRIACQDLTSNPEFEGCRRAGFFAVFDGHAGHEAAEYLENHLLHYLLSRGQEQLRSHPLQALEAAVNQAEREILTRFVEARCNAGSTLLALLLVDDKLYIANVGDSRAVLGRGSEAQQLTRDHKPACSYEQQRIEADDPAAEISCDGYMYGELAVARAIGSAHIKRDPSKRALIPTPDLMVVQLRAEDDFVVLATDGLWDKVDNAEVVSVARRSLASSRDADTAARALVERALRRASSDNISVITLLLHSRAISLPKSNSMLFKRSQLSGLAGIDSPRCSTPCSGVSTPVSATPRSGTPSGPNPNA